MSLKQGKLRYYIPEINAVAYALLVILIPFIMLQNYLQSTIYLLNDVKFSVLDYEIPLLVTVFILILVSLCISFRKNLTLYRIISFIILLLLLLLAEGLTDHYVSSNFTNLQNNWHYFAYGTFTVILYRLYNLRGKPLHKIILYTFLICISLSTIDEAYQYFLSSRVFDISDIAKDSWGCSLGLISVFFVFRERTDFKKGFTITHKHIRDYFKEPTSLLSLQILFSFLLVYFGSLLTDHQYLFYGIFIPLAIFIFLFILIHIAQHKLMKRIIIIILSIAIIIQTASLIIHYNDDFSYCDNDIIIYKGIIIPFFDIKVSSRGGFSLIDKKEDFILQDIRFLINQQHKIIIIGKGNDNSGGKGFYKQNNEDVHFLFNTYKNEGIQLIILDSKSACTQFNRLKKSGFDVLMVIHNS